MKSRIGLFALTLLITGSIDSIRNLPATALFGSTLIFFFVLGGLFFLIPTGLVSAELSATFTEEGGIYHWTRLAFGEKMAVLAIWLQWINTMVWYPTILSFIVGTVAYLVNPALASNKLYLILSILIVFWVLTLINLRGLKVSATFASVCGLLGMVIPMVLIIYLAITWVATGHPIQVNLHWNNLIPNMHQSENWISLTAIMAAFLGMELATVHVNQVKDPQKTFPNALVLSICFILVTMILGSLAIAVVTPAAKINLVDGIMQAFSEFLSAFHLSFCLPIIGILILIGSVGGMINWIISPAKGLLQAAEQGYLPKFFSHTNKHGASSVMLITQAIVVSIVCFAFLLMPSVNGSYWFLTDLSTELYILMYMLMFVSAMMIKHKYRKRPAFRIPGGRFGMYTTCIFGLLGCALTLVIGFFPPSNIDVGTPGHYHMLFSLGIVGMIVPVLLFYAYKKFSSRS